MKEVVTISVEAKNMEGERVIDASFIVEPPRLIPQIEEALH